MNRIRSQRRMLKDLRNKGKITRQAYRQVRQKAKGGYFRSRRHIQLYLEGSDALTKEKAPKEKPKERTTKKNDSTIQKKERKEDRLQ